MDKSNFVIGIQARTNSSRLPNKIGMNINSIPMWLHVYRSALLTNISTVMLVPDGDPLIEQLKFMNIPFVTGPEESPLERYQKMNFPYDFTIRLTADCPLVSPYMILDMAYQCDCEEGKVFMYNELDGMDIQIAHESIFTFGRYLDNEHVFDMDQIKKDGLYHKYEPHLSVDTMEDFRHVSFIMKGGISE